MIYVYPLTDTFKQTNNNYGNLLPHETEHIASVTAVPLPWRLRQLP